MVLKGSHQSMSDFVIGNHFFLLVGENGVFLLVTSDYHFNALFQVCFCNDCTSVTDCTKCCFVYNICQLGSGCTRCHTCDGVEIHIIGCFDFSCMNLQNCFTSCKIGKLNWYAAVKTSWTGKCRVKGFRAVGSCQNDNTVVAFETIHLCEQLVQCLLTLIVAAYLAVTFFTDGINLINEYDTWGFLFRLLKKITNFGSTHTYKHFYKFRTGHGKEWNIRFSGNGFGKHCFTGTWRAYKENAFRHGSSHICVFLRVVKIIYNLCKVFLGFILSGYI